MAKDSVQLDIFGSYMPKTLQANKNDWFKVLNQIQNKNLLNPQIDFLVLLDLVYKGLLSARSASYFATGRASLRQVELLGTFLRFFNDYRNIDANKLIPETVFLLKVRELWLQKNPVAVENLFEFPLAELDCETVKFERLSDIDLKELQNI